MKSTPLLFAALWIGFLTPSAVGAFEDSPAAVKGEILTNSALFKNSPPWLKTNQAQRVIDQVERKLEWSTQRVTVTFFKEPAAFSGLLQHPSPRTLAVTRAWEKSVLMGPLVTEKNFAVVFAHEMTHVILYQKYQGRVPAWLEEGMANFISNNTAIDYEWLAKQPRLNVNQLSHPLDARTQADTDYKYMASLGVVIMLKQKCPDFRELLNLSLKENLQAFIPTYCQIPDLNQSFWEWVDKNKKNNKWTRKS